MGKAEALLIASGFERVRVRIQGLAARIEVPKQRIRDLVEFSESHPLVAELLTMGFTSVSLDLEGLISGKLNRGELKGTQESRDQLG